jgi:DNA-binding response OmpR family regulator
MEGTDAMAEERRRERLRALEARCAPFLAKPFTVEKLLARVREALDGASHR